LSRNRRAVSDSGEPHFFVFFSFSGSGTKKREWWRETIRRLEVGPATSLILDWVSLRPIERSGPTRNPRSSCCCSLNGGHCGHSPPRTWWTASLKCDGVKQKNGQWLRIQQYDRKTRSVKDLCVLVLGR
jgi:hypothetical protein